MIKSYGEWMDILEKGISAMDILESWKADAYKHLEKISSLESQIHDLKEEINSLKDEWKEVYNELPEKNCVVWGCDIRDRVESVYLDDFGEWRTNHFDALRIITKWQYKRQPKPY